MEPTEQTVAQAVSILAHRSRAVVFIDSLQAVAHICPRDESDDNGNHIPAYQPHHDVRTHTPEGSIRPIYQRITEDMVTPAEWWVLMCLACGLRSAVETATNPQGPEDNNPPTEPTDDVARATFVNEADDTDTNTDTGPHCTHRKVVPFAQGAELYERCCTCNTEAPAGCL